MAWWHSTVIFHLLVPAYHMGTCSCPTCPTSILCLWPGQIAEDEWPKSLGPWTHVGAGEEALAPYVQVSSSYCGHCSKPADGRPVFLLPSLQQSKKSYGQGQAFDLAVGTPLSHTSFWVWISALLSIPASCWYRLGEVAGGSLTSTQETWDEFGPVQAVVGIWAVKQQVGDFPQCHATSEVKI